VQAPAFIIRGQTKRSVARPDRSGLANDGEGGFACPTDDAAKAPPIRPTVIFLD